MSEKTLHDLLSSNIDSNETKVLNATTIYSLRSVSPGGEIIFDSTEAVIPGTLNTTASLAISASLANTASFIDGGSF